jgi:hypothetical protein
MKRKRKIGYRVEIKLLDTARQGFHLYSGPSVTLEMAQALAEHLKRSKSAGRIVNNATDFVQESWEAL